MKMCKADYAHIVNDIMHITKFGLIVSARIFDTNTCKSRINKAYFFHVDISVMYNVHNIKYTIAQHDSKQKNQIPETRALSASQPRAGAGRAISARSVLRSERPDPGQIRDAATRFRKARLGQKQHRPIWPVATGVLYGAARLSTGRPAGTVAQARRSPSAAQAHRDDSGSHAAAPARRTRHQHQTTAAMDSAAPSGVGTPNHHRTGVARKQKKTPLVDTGVTDWQCRYETIRAEVTAPQTMPPQPDVWIIVQRGLAAWMHHPPSPPAAVSQPLRATAECATDTQLTRVLTAMLSAHAACAAQLSPYS